MKRLLCLFAVPILGGAQIASVDIATPTLGYVFDEQAKSVRAIEGVPGAASIGNTLNLGASIDWIRIAPSRRFGIASNPDVDSLLLVRLNGLTAVAERTDLPIGDATFSPSGETVALLLADRVEVWSGMPDHPTKGRSFPTGEVIQKAEKLLVSDDGVRVLVLSGGTLWRLSDEGAPEELGSGYRDAAFLRLGYDLAALSANRLVLIRKFDTDSMEEMMDGVGEASTLALSGDERTIALLDETGAVMLVNRETHAVSRVPLDGAIVEGLWRSQGNAVFQLTRSAANDVWMLDGDAESPRMFAVGKRGDQ